MLLAFLLVAISCWLWYAVSEPLFTVVSSAVTAKGLVIVESLGGISYTVVSSGEIEASALITVLNLKCVVLDETVTLHVPLTGTHES